MAIETTGKTIDAAIAAALAQLQTDRDSVSVEVLENPKSGFLGLGGTPARVRVKLIGEEDEPPKPVAPPKKREEAKPSAPVTSVQKTNPPVPPKKPDEPPMPQKSQKQDIGGVPSGAAAVLKGILDRMGIKDTAINEEPTEHHLMLNVSGANMGRLIGRRGETLDAVQRIVSASINRGASERRRIVVDAERYRAKREEALVQLALTTAEKAVKYNRDMLLEPMNAYSRHVIHTALQDNQYVTTHSVGNEPQRRVIISLSGANKKPAEVRKKV